MMEEPNYLYEAETSVLGSIMLDSHLMEDCVLLPESFSPDWDNGKIFEVLQYAYRQFKHEKNPFDIVVMASHWGPKLNKIGGVGHLVNIMKSVPTTGMFKHYQEVVNRDHVRREIEKAGMQMAAGATLEELQEESKRISDIEAKTAQAGDIQNIADLISVHEQIIAKRSTNKEGITGTLSCSDDLNRLTKGHQKGDFTVIGARPSVGKTALIVNELESSTRDGSAAFLISGEDGKINILERLMASVGRIDLAHMKSGQMTNPDWERYTKATEIITDRKIFIDDTSAPTIEAIRRKVAKLVKDYPRLTLYVDYLQHLRSEKKFGSEREMYKYISYELKQIAKQFDIPVVCLAALSRKVDERPDKRPVMSDIRDCGNIESDADVVIFLYRDDYYNADSNRKGLMDLIVAKGRNVGTGTVSMFFDKPRQALINLTDEMKQKRREKGYSAS